MTRSDQEDNCDAVVEVERVQPAGASIRSEALASAADCSSSDRGAKTDDPTKNQDGEGGGVEADEHDDDDEEMEGMMEELAGVEAPIMLGSSSSSENDDVDDADGDEGERNEGEILQGAEGGSKKAPPSSSDSVGLNGGWDEDAAVRCFDLSVRSYGVSEGGEGEWEPLGPPRPPETVVDSPDAMAQGRDEECGEGGGGPSEGTSGSGGGGGCGKDSTSKTIGGGWKPRPIPLPTWAVDPFYAGKGRCGVDSRGGEAPSGKS